VSSAPALQGVGEFDVSDLVQFEVKRNILPARLQQWALLVVGALLIYAGIDVAFIQPDSLWTYPRSILGLALSASGGMLMLVSPWGPRALRNRPTKLFVTDDSIAWAYAGSSKRNEIYWSDPNLKITIINGRRRRERLGQRDKVAEYALMFGPRSSMPITSKAVNAVLHQANSHRLGVTQRPFRELDFIEITGIPGTS